MNWLTSRRVWILVGLAALLVVLLLYLNSRRAPAEVAVAQVERTDLTSAITSNGQVEPVSPYALRAKFDGFVDQVPGVEGENVRAGQLLVVLDDRDVRAQLDQSRAQLASEENELQLAQAGGRPDQRARLEGDLRTARAQRDLLQQQNQALTKLVAEMAATRQELETNHAELARAEASLEQAQKAMQEFENQVQLDRQRLPLLVAHTQAQVSDLLAKVDSAHVVAPVSGTLYALSVHPRDFVHTGDLLADVADLSKVRVRAYIDEPELGRLKVDLPVTVTWDALAGRSWTGATENVPRQVVARGARRVGEVLCSISNEKMDLIPNTTVDVRIQVAERKNVLVVPRGAVQFDDAHRYVFLVNGGRLHRREITTGVSTAENFEVLSGLQEGDTVALPLSVPLKNNMAVQVVSPQ
jgi:HlyD family secretion protein